MRRDCSLDLDPDGFSIAGWQSLLAYSFDEFANPDAVGFAFGQELILAGFCADDLITRLRDHHSHAAKLSAACACGGKWAEVESGACRDCDCRCHTQQNVD